MDEQESIMRQRISPTQERNHLSDAEFQEFILKKKEDQRKDRGRITFFSNPFATIYYFLTGVIVEKVSDLISLCKRNQAKTFSILFLIVVACVILYIPGPQEKYIFHVRHLLEFSIWWIFLGVLSAIGLGTGLHTFVLYLGPYIARVTLTATLCRSIDFATDGDNAFICPRYDSEDMYYDPTLWQILGKVELAAFLWGFGTALGELPPYFVARAAKMGEQSLEELRELTNDGQNGERENQEEGGEGDREITRFDAFMSRAKAMMFYTLTNYGFIAILLFASIPNPLFDLAGLTCGHFQVPFWTFFGATMIGKALIKVNIQAIFVIFMFSASQLKFLIQFVEKFSESLADKLIAYVESEKQKLHEGSNNGNEPAPKGILSILWDLFLFVMISYFILSVIQSSVTEYLVRRDEKLIHQLISERDAIKNGSDSASSSISIEH